ncbi:MAG: hypothetical protein JXB04_12070, partial [Kiritimatiellae bacterium]|nr:hypothetical protein [Kiritimatiellia bacterium]
LSSLGTITFGLRGDPASVKVEFTDQVNSRMVCVCTNLGGTTRYYSFNTSVFTNDVQHISAISFVVDQGLAGSNDLSGEFVAVSDGLDYQINVVGAGGGTPTVMPGKPIVIAVGGANDNTVVSQASTSLFSVAFNLTTGGWTGATILFDNYGTPEFEYQDLSAFSQLTFGLTAAVQNVALEVMDTNGNRAVGTLVAPSGSAWQYYSIAKTDIENKNVDMSRIRMINFVVDQNRAGAGQYIGALGVRSAGLYYPIEIGGMTTGALTHLPVNTEEGAPPTAIVVGGGNGDTVLEQPTNDIVRITYNVTTGGWSGTTFLYDNYGTVPFESADLSGPAYTALTFRIRGDLDGLKFEFEDTNGVKVSGTFTGITTNWQYYTVSRQMLVDEGLDPAVLRFINFVVDQNVAGASHYESWFEVSVEGLYYELTLVGAGSGTPTVLPNLPDALAVGGANGDTVVECTNSSLIYVSYNVGTGGWSGATILYDDYGTPAVVESEDLSGFTELVFGLYGDPASVKIEVVDSSNRVVRATCTGVAPGVQYYTLPAAEVTNDLTRIAAISFVVDQALAGEAAWTGEFRVVSGGLNYPLNIGGAGSGELTLFPTSAPQVIVVGGANGDTVLEQYSTNWFKIEYSVTTGGWSGASILYDDYGTVPFESGDFSSITTFVVRVLGDPASIAFEVEDTNGTKVSGSLTGVSGSWQYYGLPLDVIGQRGVDLAHVRFVNFLVTSNIVGSALSGLFEIQALGLGFANPAYGQDDSDGDGMPDDYERAQGLDPYDDGSTDPDNGPDGDPDGDGVPNSLERMAGTDPRDPGSAPLIDIVLGNSVDVSFPAVAQRFYQVQRKLNLVTSEWENVTVSTLWTTSSDLVYEESGAFDTAYYRVMIGYAEESPMPGKPALVLTGGGNTETVLDQRSTREFYVSYDVSTGGYCGASMTFDDYGTVPIESVDVSGYETFTFAVSGTPASVKYEFEDASGAKVAGAFQYVESTLKWYTIDAAWLAAGGLDLAHLRTIHFIVDPNTAGPATVGQFYVRTLGLSYTVQVSGEGAGSATSLSAPAPVAYDLGGANHSGNWIQTGSTNLWVSYDVTGGGWDGVTISHDNFSSEPIESADYSALTGVVFGVFGTPDNIKIEFQDASNRVALAVCSGVTAGRQYFAVPTAGLEDIGIDLSQVRLINFVVDQGLAGSGNGSGSFTIVTEGLAP